MITFKNTLKMKESRADARRYADVKIDILRLEEEGFKYLEELFPFVILELIAYFKARQINLFELELVDYNLYEFFDERNIIISTRYNLSSKYFYSADVITKAKSSINKKNTFPRRYEATVAGLLNGIKIRDKQIKLHLRDKRIATKKEVLKGAEEIFKNGTNYNK